ncbi:MAG: hypothetical protein N3E49_03790 [Bacteroidia bacterium]|nr:hypothetical protein [Bacteroidia bacterium]
MRIAIAGPPNDIHVRRWGKALRQAGAEVVFVWITPAPPDLEAYYCVGLPVDKPRFSDFFLRGRALRELLGRLKVRVAHPIHLTPSALWVWYSGFRPYIPFAMGADVLEYTSASAPVQRSWTLQSRSPTLMRLTAAWMRRRILPSLLRRVLQESILSLGDNYEVCFSKKFFEKNKPYIEIPAGIEPQRRTGTGEIFLAPRGATLLYQADVILKGYERYLRSGGTRSLVLLSAGYPIHPAILKQAERLEELYPEAFVLVRRLLSKPEIEALWQRTAAFISAPLYDGYSYAVAEGRSRGALPIVNAIPAHMEVLTHGYNAWFVEPFTAQNLANALFEVDALLQGDPFWRLRNQQWIDRFSNIEDNASLFLHLLRRIL